MEKRWSNAIYSILTTIASARGCSLTFFVFKFSSVRRDGWLLVFRTMLCDAEDTFCVLLTNTQMSFEVTEKQFTEKILEQKFVAEVVSAVDVF